MVAANRIAWAAVVLTLGMVTMPGCGTPAPAMVAPQAPEAPSVTVSRSVVCEVTDYLEFPGRTEAVGEVEIRARVTGYLVKINFEDGQEVKQGDLLFEIDPRPYQAALDRTTGELKRLQALLAKAQADVQRGDRLRASGAITEEEYEEDVADVKTNEAAIQSAEAAVRDAELNLEFTKIVSPIDGRISKRRITEGNLIQPGTNESAVLTTVVTVDPIYVCFSIDEPALLKFRNLDWRLGQDGRPRQIKELKVPVEIGLPNEEGFPHQGTLDFLDNKVDRTTGTLCARGTFDNATQYLSPGLFVRVRVPFGKPHQATLVSERAIGTDQRRKYVLVVNEDHVVERREVKLGALQKGLRVIESGIGPDDLVIVNGLQRARPGMKVNPHFSQETAGAAAPVVAHRSEKTVAVQPN